jgi:two-component system response regulator AtoC
MRARILVVDDEPSIRKVLSAQLTRDGHEVLAVADGFEALRCLADEPWNLVITDLRMPGLGGMELLAHVHVHQPGLPVVVLTAHATVEAAIAAMKLGAQDFLTKPFDHAALQAVVAKALGTERARSRSVQPDGALPTLVGVSDAAREVRASIERVAGVPTPVLVLGELGCGKELVARAIHAASPRRDGPFVAVHCDALPAGHAESELFGHERGAIPGAPTARPGRAELADGGTLFLDDVTALPRDAQARLLSLLEGGTMERVGALRPTRLDVRVVAASTTDPAAWTGSGRFREDLAYRLGVVPIRIPALRERPDDVLPFVAHALARFAARQGRAVPSVSPEAYAVLEAWSWPGNFRELENVVERALLLCDGAVIEARHVAPLVPLADEAAELVRGLKDTVRVHTARLERDLIARVLAREGGNVTRAARALDVSRKGLQLKMKEYGLRGLDEDEPRG